MGARRTEAEAAGFRFAACVVLTWLSVPVVAQTIAWEMLPFVQNYTAQQVNGVLFLPGEGEAGQDPSQDAIIALHRSGTVQYNPGGNNGEWGDWRMLCRTCGVDDGVRTELHTMVVSRYTRMHRSADRGLTWEIDLFGETSGLPLFQTQLYAYTDSAGNGRILGGEAGLIYSDHDGRRNTWVRVNDTRGDPLTFADVPPSPAHPPGRLLAGTWNGISYSDDGGITWSSAATPGTGRWIGNWFAFYPQEGHPFGGPMLVGAEDLTRYVGPGSVTILRSDDGGLSWSLLHRFDDAAMELPETDLGLVGSMGTVLPDGSILASVWEAPSMTDPQQPGAISPARLLRSTDGGQTWTREEPGWNTITGTDYLFQVNAFRLSRTGVLYAGTHRGLWRTTAPVVSAEVPAASSSRLALAVSPNPSSGAVTLSLSSRVPVVVEVSVVDAAGRQVVRRETWASPVAPSLRLSTAGWASGVYVARMRAGSEHVAVHFTVAR